LEIVDCGVFFGPQSKGDLDTSIEKVLSILDQGGINRALVTSLTGLFHSFEDGNEDTVRVCKDRPERLIPLATLNPRQTVDLHGAVEKIVDADFKIVGFFPSYQAWSLRLHCFEKAVLEVADAGLVPLLTLGGDPAGASSQMEFDGSVQLTHVSRVARLLGKFDSPIIVRWMEGAGYLLTAEYVALGKDFSNLYFDMGNMVTIGSIELLIDEIGEDRIVYGSNTPFQYLKSSLFMLQTILISEEQRKKIASGNILKIIGEK